MMTLRTLTELLKTKTALYEEIDAAQKKFDKEQDARKAEYEIINAIHMLYLEHSMDLAHLDVARKVIYVRGPVIIAQDAERTLTRQQVVQDAMNEVVKGGGRLLTLFYGTKHYATWKDQRSDHPYGFMPSHGTTQFAIGVRDPKRFTSDTAHLSTWEIDAILYVLARVREGTFDNCPEVLA